jgi:hypothetical protein
MLRTTEEDHVGWLANRGKQRPGTLRTANSADQDHLLSFLKERNGVEAYLEPRTTVTDTTVVLVADSGEWTRRRVESESAAHSFARKHAIPIYDAGRVGYPQRMRDWTARQKANGEASPT